MLMQYKNLRPVPLDSSPALRYTPQLPLLLQSLGNIGRDSENGACLHGRLGPELFYPSFWSTTIRYHQNLPCLSKLSRLLYFIVVPLVKYLSGLITKWSTEI